MTVDEALAHARARCLERIDAQLLLAHTTGRSRAWLLAHGENLLDGDQAAQLVALVRRRADGEPLAYLVGEKEFHGLALEVDARVLVPRPDTELLVDWAIELLRGELTGRPQPRVLDLGTGSGAIALALKRACPAIEMHAVDASAPALAVAQRNAERLGLDVHFAHGSWWQATQPGMRFDLAVANPPYIAAGDVHLAALRHEPAQALTPGPSGMEALQTIVGAARPHLAEGTWLLLEHGFDQAAAVAGLLANHGFDAVATRHDLAGHARCTGGRV